MYIKLLNSPLRKKPAILTAEKHFKQMYAQVRAESLACAAELRARGLLVLLQQNPASTGQLGDMGRAGEMYLWHVLFYLLFKMNKQ